MKKYIRILSLAMILCMIASVGYASSKPKATATPAPLPVSADVIEEVPEQIQQVLDIAYNEWNTLAGKTLTNCNKYTEWRGKGVSFGWCGGFITWCMLEAGVPQERLADIAKETEVPGIVHVKEAAVTKLTQGYLEMNRTTNIPQKGFLVVYGCTTNPCTKYIHIGLVYDVQKLDNGKYRITTLEGNMSKRVKMFVRDYDPNVEGKSGNLTVVPEDERTQEETSWFNYKISKSCSKWYVNTFLMPWIPGETETETAAETEAAPEAEPAVTPEPVQ